MMPLAVAEIPPKELRLIMLTPFVDYAFFDPVRKGMNDAAKAIGVKATFAGTADGDVQALASKVRQSVNDGYDGIALNIIDPIAFDEVVSDAIKKNVSVIAFNVDDSRTTNARLAAVGQNMLEAGRTFGRDVAKFVPDKSHILMTMHDPNISALEDRSRGAQEILKPRGVSWIELITGTDRELAVEKIHAALKADPRIKVILSTGSADTEAAGLAIERYFPEQGYICAGFDLSPVILRLIQAGTIKFSVDQQPYLQGYLSIVTLALHRRYGLMPANIDTGTTIITADKVEQVLELSKQRIR
jgi:simple sugar transport system substrate-binding protein